MSDRQFRPPDSIVDPHADRLLGDLVAIGALEGNDRPSVDERLVAKLGVDLLRALRVELDCSNSGSLPIRLSPHRAA